MNFVDIIDELIVQISDFAQANPLLSLAILLVAAYLIYRKPAFFFSVFILGLILVGVLYLIGSMSASGVSQKEKLIRKGAEPEPSNIFRPPGMTL